MLQSPSQGPPKGQNKYKELSGARHPICQWRHPKGSPHPAIPRDDGTDWMDGWSRSSRAWSQRYNRVGPWPSSHGKSILDTESQNKDKTYLTLLYLPPPSGPLLIFICEVLFKLGVKVWGGTGVIVACASRRVQKWRILYAGKIWGSPFLYLKINVGGTLADDFLGREERVVGLQCTSCIGDGGRDLTMTWLWYGTASGRRAVSERNTRSIRTRFKNVLESSSFLIISKTLRNDSFF